MAELKKSFLLYLTIVIISCIYTQPVCAYMQRESIESNTTLPLLQTDNLILTCDGTGKISSVNIEGKDCTHPVSRSKSGFYFFDVKKQVWYAADIALNSTSNVHTQGGNVPDADLTLTAQYTTHENILKVDGTINDITGLDRLIKVQYRIPYASEGMIWYEDLNNRIEINSPTIYSNVTSMTGAQKASILPFGVVSNGISSLAMAVNMNAPYSFVIDYNNEENNGYMTISFDFVLSPKTEKTISKADFSFVIYATDPQWGMRSAAQIYYNAFPEYFIRRVEEGGNWLYQQRNYAEVYGLEDFGFKFNETPNFINDKNYRIISFCYVAPSEKWIGWPDRVKYPEPSYDDFISRLMYCLTLSDSIVDFDFKMGKMNASAAAVLNSGIYSKDKKLEINSWYAYGPMVNFVVNGSPSIPGINFFNLCEERIKKGQRQAAEDGYILGGIYLDNLNYPGIHYNYRSEHYKYSKYPLIWDNSMQPALPLAFSQYEFSKGIHNIAIQSNKYTLANFAFPKQGAVMYVPLVDIPGGEIGYGWGNSYSDYAVRRSLAYRKPWTLLYTQHLPGGEVKELSYEEREQIMRRGMVYGVFANIIGLGPAINAYDTYRPIFRKYLPATMLADKFGWNPVTYASADKNNIIIERYGSIAEGNCMLTMINTNENSHEDYTIAVNLKKLGLKNGKQDLLVAYDLISKRILPSTINNENGNTSIYFSISLDADEAAAVLVESKEEIFKLLKLERIDKQMNRVRTALKKLAGEFEVMGIGTPKGWRALDKKSTMIYIALNKLSFTEKKWAFIEKIEDVLSKARDISKNMSEYKKYFDADITYVYEEIYSLISGLHEVSSIVN